MLGRLIGLVIGAGAGAAFVEVAKAFNSDYISNEHPEDAFVISILAGMLIGGTVGEMLFPPSNLWGE